jgi:hypothetical protein
MTVVRPVIPRPVAVLAKLHIESGMMHMPVDSTTSTAGGGATIAHLSNSNLLFRYAAIVPPFLREI